MKNITKGIIYIYIYIYIYEIEKYYTKSNYAYIYIYIYIYMKFKNCNFLHVQYGKHGKVSILYSLTLDVAPYNK